MPGKRLIRVDFLQPAHHAFQHGVKVGQVRWGQGAPEGVPVGLSALDRRVHPARFLRVQRVAHDQPIPRPQCLLAGVVVDRVIAPLAHQRGHGLLVARARGRVLGLANQRNQLRAQRCRLLQPPHPATA